MIEKVKPTMPVERITFRDVAECHIDQIEALGRKRSTVEDYRQRLRVHLEPAFGPMAIGEIGRDEIERFQMAKLRKGQAPKTVRNHMALLHGIFKYADQHGLIESNPVKLVDKPKIRPNQDIKYLTLAELERLIREVPDDALGQVERALYEAAAKAGMRLGELLGVRWRYIDFGAHKIRVRETFVRKQFDTPKSMRGSRAIPLDPKLARSLKEHRLRSHWSRNDDLVFAHPETGKPIDRSTVYHRYRKARNRAKITKVPFKGLRHTFGTTLAMAGIELLKIKEWMGHEDIQTTMIYAHFMPGEDDAARVAQAFRSQSGHKLRPSAHNSGQLEAGPVGTD
jgi:integrase